MGRWTWIVIGVLAACDAKQRAAGPERGGERPTHAYRLVEARAGFTTRLTRKEADGRPAAMPPRGVFDLVRYQAPVGPCPAYLTPDPGDHARHPAIVWITGGDSSSPGPIWEAAPADNDQTAAAYREAGIVTMFPSLRGGDDCPGVKEVLLGEVDDVLAAADYLRRQPYVDPTRIYLGGHSNGGTLVLLVAESTDRFRAVFAFGPVADVGGLGEYARFDVADEGERRVRSPIHWLADITTPTFVIEGSSGNADSVRTMEKAPHSAAVQLFVVPHASHFTLLAPTNATIARKILDDRGPTSRIALTADELARPFRIGGATLFCTDLVADGKTFERAFCRFDLESCEEEAKQDRGTSACRETTEPAYCVESDGDYLCTGQRRYCDAAVETLKSRGSETTGCREWTPGTYF